jgi:roadblock/LC7 domain-containing protein
MILTATFHRTKEDGMATLDELLHVPGVMAAGEFSPDGKLVDYKANMEMSRDLATMTAQFCATVTMMFNTLAGAFTPLSKMQWTPQQGWAYSGGEWTVAVGGTRGVFVKTAQADFNKLFQVLVGPR